MEACGLTSTVTQSPVATTATTAAATPRVPLPPPSCAPIASILQEAELKLNTDRRLADVFAKAGNVALPMLFRIGEPRGRPDKDLPDFVRKNSIKLAKSDESSLIPTADVDASVIEPVGKSAAAIGHLNVTPDVDGGIRSEALVLGYFDEVYPSLALLVAAKSLNLGPADIQVQPGDSVRLAKLKIGTDADTRMSTFFYKNKDGQPAFAVDSFFDVKTGKIPYDKYRDRNCSDRPHGGGRRQRVCDPDYAEHVGGAAAGACRIQHSFRAFLCGANLGRLGREGGVSADRRLSDRVDRHALRTDDDAVDVAAVDGTGHLLLTTKRFLVAERGKEKSDLESAESMFRYMFDYNPKFRDLEQRLNRAKQMSETVILGGGGGGRTNVSKLDGAGNVEKPMLGRYQIEKELGKGAMGVVYLGRDPRINRVVAIKTMALSQEFEADELVEVKERFFREAETAGRLNHQNIVTMYDAGEEQDLAYIAMELLKGKALVKDSDQRYQTGAGMARDLRICMTSTREGGR